MIGDRIKSNTGKVFRRISDGAIMGNEVVLGYFFTPEELPILEMPEHFEQIDEIKEPITEETEITTEEYPLIATGEEIMTLEEEYGEPLPQELKRVTVQDYLNLKNEVEQIKKMIYGNTI